MLMVNNLAGFGARRAAASSVFDPITLFASSEQGAWYDPSDLSTMFQNTVGTTPVTSDGQPVGVILDKSKGLVLGTELVTNGTFDTNTTGWTPSNTTLSVVSGELEILSSSASLTRATQYFAIVAGKTYKITGTMRADAANTRARSCRLRIECSDIVFANYVTANGVQTPVSGFFTATSGGCSVLLEVANDNDNGNSGDKAYFDNISVKEIPGNHAIQATAAARPLHSATGLAEWTNYDAIDDVLNTTFPSSLGSSCTVAKAVVGGSPTILTGQTIGTSWAESTDNAGLIIINRALTGQETTDLTAWLTAKGATS